MLNIHQKYCRETFYDGKLVGFDPVYHENFNFAYDVMDAWAAEKPDKLALLWTDDEDNCVRFTFKDIKEQSDRAASYFMQLGIGRGDGRGCDRHNDPSAGNG